MTKKHLKVQRFTKTRLTSGETIVESLVGMLIISLVFVFLVNAVLVAAHLNAEVKNSDVSYDLDGEPMIVNTVTILVDGNAESVDLYSVNAQTGNTRYYYYERHED